MLTLTPVSLAEANAFVAAYHRHHKPTVGHKFSIGCLENGRLVGVAIVGRPVSRYLDDGETLEVNRLCTTGEKNASLFFTLSRLWPRTSSVNLWSLARTDGFFLDSRRISFAEYS